MWTDTRFIFRALPQRLHCLVYGRALSLTLEISEHHGLVFSTWFSANANIVVVFHPNPSTELSVRLCHRAEQCPPSPVRLNLTVLDCSLTPTRRVYSVCVCAGGGGNVSLVKCFVQRCFQSPVLWVKFGMWCIVCSLRCYLSVLLSSLPLLFPFSSSSFLLQLRQLFSFTSLCFILREQHTNCLQFSSFCFQICSGSLWCFARYMDLSMFYCWIKFWIHLNLQYSIGEILH